MPDCQKNEAFVQILNGNKSAVEKYATITFFGNKALIHLQFSVTFCSLNYGPIKCMTFFKIKIKLNFFLRALKL